VAKEACVYGNSGLITLVYAPGFFIAGHLPKPYVYGKRGLRVWQKRPMCMAKEAYVYAPGFFIAGHLPKP